MKTKLSALLSALAVLSCQPSPPLAESGTWLLADQSRGSLTATELEALAERVALHATEALAANAAQARAPAPSCADGDRAAAHAHALTVAGNLEGCSSYARACAGAADYRLDLAEARCAHYALDFDGAHTAYERAMARGAPAGVAVSYAHFALSTQYQDEVDGILARGPGLTADERGRFRQLLDYLVTSKLVGTTRDEVEAFVLARLARGGDAALVALLKTAWLASLVNQQYRYADALSFLDQRLAGWGLPATPGSEPNRWLASTVSAFYVMPDRGFEWARRVYEPVAAHATAITQLPTEQNPFMYSELYASVCRDALLPAAGLASLKETARQWKAGAISPDRAIERASALFATYGRRRADLLTFLGGVEESLGDDAAAAALFLEAHGACKYYNRSHWGLLSVRRRATWSAYDDYERLVASIDQTLADVRFPASLAQYVTNYASLNEGERTRLKYAMRFWAPHVDHLVRDGQRLYMKRGFELLSETPGLERIRDTRITYPHDQRLWDDVRGIGGNPVVADVGETDGAAFGAFNLVAHEVAHQVHLKAPARFSACLDRLYLAAKARGVFPDPYASTNVLEYFAQGVTYYNVPEDAPARFGINRSWLAPNDPDLLAVVQSVERTSGGDLGTIPCPIPAPEGRAPEALRGPLEPLVPPFGL